MRKPHAAALRTASQARELQGEMAAPLALPRLGIPFLGKWGHRLLLRFGDNTLEGGQLCPGAARRAALAGAVAEVEVFTTLGTKPLTVRTAKRLHQQ